MGSVTCAMGPVTCAIGPQLSFLASASVEVAFFSFTSPFLIHYRYLEEVKVIQVVWLYFLLLTALMSVVAYLLMRI